MSKELEALEYLKPFRWEDKKAKEVYDTIKKAITPPTADDVCKALSKYFGRKVIYVDTFYVALNEQEECNLYGYLDINIIKDKPHLITLIGRFYEGLTNTEHNNSITIDTTKTPVGTKVIHDGYKRG